MTLLGYVIGLILAGMFYAFCAYIGIGIYFKKVKKDQERELKKLDGILKGVEKDVQGSGKSGTID